MIKKGHELFIYTKDNSLRNGKCLKLRVVTFRLKLESVMQHVKKNLMLHIFRFSVLRF